MTTTSDDAQRAGGETPTMTVTALAEHATYMIEHLRGVGESVNAGHDRYIPNDADDAADLIAEMRAALLARHRDGERDTPAASPEPRMDWLMEDLETAEREAAANWQKYWDILNGLTTPVTYYSPAAALLHAARNAVKEMSKPENQPVYGPRAAMAIALEKGIGILEAIEASASPEPTPNKNVDL